MCVGFLPASGHLYVIPNFRKPNSRKFFFTLFVFGELFRVLCYCVITLPFGLSDIIKKRESAKKSENAHLKLFTKIYFLTKNFLNCTH